MTRFTYVDTGRVLEIMIMITCPHCLQLPVSSPWTQTQQTHTCYSLRRTGRWHGWTRSSITKTIQTDLNGIPKFSAEKAYLDLDITGRWCGIVESLTLEWLTKEWVGWDGGLTVGLDKIPSPGVWTALVKVTITFTMREAISHSSVVLFCTELVCILTGLLVLCPSIVCPLVNRNTFTHSTPHSLNPSILGSGLLPSQWPCVR